jgi:lipooligosaccharide transport system permease protein
MRKFMWEIIFYSVANPFLYLMAIGVGVGSMVNQNSGGVDGVEYLVFLAPALLANAAVQGAMDEAIFPTLAGFLWNKGFFAMNATPLEGRQIALGVYLAAMVRNFFTVLLYFFVMMAFGVLEDPKSWLLIPTGFLAGAAFAAIMIAIAGNTKKEDHFFTFVGRFVLQPMFFLSGTFFPLDSVPIYLRWIGWLSPLWHATDLGRYLSYGREMPIWLVLTHIAVLLIMVVVGLAIAIRVFEKRLAK